MYVHMCCSNRVALQSSSPYDLTSAITTTALPQALIAGWNGPRDAFFFHSPHGGVDGWNNTRVAKEEASRRTVALSKKLTELRKQGAVVMGAKIAFLYVTNGHGATTLRNMYVAVARNGGVTHTR